LKAVFLDRDGVINVDKGYLSRWEDFEFLPGAVDAMRRFVQAGYALVIVTNQSGLARGYYSVAQYEERASRIKGYLEQRGVHITGMYYCPHYKDGIIEELSIQCECRKPAPGMLLKAQSDYGLDMAHSILVGDKISDIQAANAAGVGRSYLVVSDMDRPNLAQLTYGVVESLFECADRLGLVK